MESEASVIVVSVYDTSYHGGFCLWKMKHHCGFCQWKMSEVMVSVYGRQGNVVQVSLLKVENGEIVMVLGRMGDRCFQRF